MSDLPALFTPGEVYGCCWRQEVHTGEPSRALWCLGTAKKTHSWPNPAAHGSLQTQAKPQLRNSSMANAAPTLLCSWTCNRREMEQPAVCPFSGVPGRKAVLMFVPALQVMRYISVNFKGSDGLCTHILTYVLLWKCDSLDFWPSS